jgi:hypothetical protein
MPSVSAQDPALAPAWIAEGITPWRLNRGNFYLSGLTWAKIRARRPWLSFGDFWSKRKRVYESRNTDTKRFFAEFQRDPEKHTEILAERRLRR